MILKPMKTLSQVIFFINLHLLFCDLLIKMFSICLIFYFVEFDGKLLLATNDN
jgi:hypothetical protein